MNLSKNIMLLFVLSLMLTSCGDIMGVEGIEPTQSETIPENLLDFRYCEVIPIFIKGTNGKAEVFNTISHNECPTDLWEALEVDVLKEELEAREVILNGPRYWTINEVTGGEISGDGKVANFGGIEMRHVASLDFKIWNKLSAEDHYKQTEVKRDNIWVYYKGTRVYELVDDEENVYMMQSYSQIEDENLTLADLLDLSSRLELPEGWSFQTRVLDEEVQLAAGGEAIVLTDDFSNTYQLVR
ncbi:MAG: hypothetical protein AAF135_08395 [Bacteroidota bacterium]